MLKIDHSAAEPIYMQICRQLKKQIISGELKTGERLKATRALCEEYHLSRNTVLSAYQQLESEGYVRSRIGSGFYVEELPGYEKAKEDTNLSFKKREKKKTCRYDFRYGALEPNLYSTSGFRRALKEATDELSNKESFFNEEASGLYGLREAICQYLFESRDMRVSPDQVLITGGHHYSISLLLKILPKSYQTLFMEEPGHDDSSATFLQAGYQLIPIEVDEGGMKVDLLSEKKRSIVYVTPSHQFPMGAILPIARRLQLISFAKKTHSYIIEDDYDASLRYKERPIPSLFSLDASDCVIYLGSFSKSLSPDLRISYIVLPAGFDRFSLQENLLISSPASALIQLCIEKYIRSGQYKTRVNKVRNLLKKKHNAILSFLEENYGDRIKVYGSGGGTHFVLKLPVDKKQEDILSFFEARNIRLYPMKDYYIQKDKAEENMVLLGYSGIPLTRLEDHLGQLKKALDELLEENS